MKALLPLLAVAALVAAFLLGRATAPQGESAAVTGLGDALRELDPLDRSHRLGRYLSQMGPEDLPDALEVLRDDRVRISPEELRLFMLAWGRFDPAGAFDAAREWPGGRRSIFLDEAAYAWGFRDGNAAMAAVESLGDPELASRLRPVVIEGWLRGEDREAAGAHIATIEDPKRRRRLIFLLAATVGTEGVDAVMRWAESVPDDSPNKFKYGVFFQSIGVVANEDPELALRWFLEHRHRPYSVDTLNLLARRWARFHDPEALFQHLRELPTEGERQGERSAAIAAGFKEWNRVAPEEARAWLGGALPDPLFDPAVAELVSTLSQASENRTQEAMEWALRIQDEEQRERSLRLAGRRWARREPEAARVWLEAAEISDALRQTILAQPVAEAARRPRGPGARPAAP